MLAAATLTTAATLPAAWRNRRRLDRLAWLTAILLLVGATAGLETNRHFRWVTLP